MTTQGPNWNTPLSLADGYMFSGMSLEELWADYRGLGGTHGRAHLAATLRWALVVSVDEHNRVADALNDRFIVDDRDLRVGYLDHLWN